MTFARFAARKAWKDVHDVAPLPLLRQGLDCSCGLKGRGDFLHILLRPRTPILEIGGPEYVVVVLDQQVVEEF